MADFSKFTQQESFEIKGTWWIVGKRAKAPGTLKYDAAHGLDLYLDAPLGINPAFGPHWFKPQDPVTIFGESDDGKAISLLRCQCTLFGTRPTYLANVALLNCHIRRLSSIRFTSFFVSHTTLDEWVSLSPYKHQWQKDHTCVISYKSPEPIPFVLKDMTLKLGHNLSTFFKPDRSIVLSYDNVLMVQPNKTVGWKRLKRLVADISRLLMLLTGDANSLLRIGGTAEIGQSNEQKDLVGQDIPFNNTVYMFRNMVAQTDTTAVFSVEMIYPYNEIADRFGDICEKWFRLANRLRPVFNVLFNEIRTKSTFQEPHFFSFAQCLEAFHRRTMETKKGKHMSKRAFRAMTKRIVASFPKRLPKGMRGVMEHKLGEANTISFLNRLEHLFSSLQPETRAFLAEDPARFIRAIRDTRNLFTHLDKKKKADIIFVRQRSDAVNKMQALLYIHILKMLGLNEADILKRISNSRRFRTEPFKFSDQPDDEDEE